MRPKWCSISETSLQILILRSLDSPWQVSHPRWQIKIILGNVTWGNQGERKKGRTHTHTRHGAALRRRGGQGVGTSIRSHRIRWQLPQKTLHSGTGEIGVDRCEWSEKQSSTNHTHHTIPKDSSSTHLMVEDTRQRGPMAKGEYEGKALMCWWSEVNRASSKLLFCQLIHCGIF